MKNFAQVAHFGLYPCVNSEEILNPQNQITVDDFFNLNDKFALDCVEY